MNLVSLKTELGKIPGDTASVNSIIEKGLHLRKVNPNADIVCLKYDVQRAGIANVLQIYGFQDIKFSTTTTGVQ